MNREKILRCHPFRADYFGIPHGHWKTLTFIAALRVDRIDAPWIIDGPMNGSAFCTYLSSCLAPTLNAGDIVVMDNLPTHKVPGVRTLLEGVGAQLWYLPPYSPDMNPIENAFAKLKALLRGAAERTSHGLQHQVVRSRRSPQPNASITFGMLDMGKPVAEMLFCNGR